MSDALSLPPRPSLEQYRKLAKDLQHAAQSGDPARIDAWAARFAAAPDRRPESDLDARRIAHFWRKLRQSRDPAARCTLAEAQFFIARAHGFASWPVFSRHLQALARSDSPVSAFEAAAGAIVSGDAAALARLLAAHPSLIRARSTRAHRSTLLHYVSANGIEDFRQKTPPNIVAIATLLLDRGADVNAESQAYGGRSTTLGLTATSCHPEAAGVQLPLMELLIARGASIDGPDSPSAVNACLHNGRGPAALALARHGARLDLEGAAGVGRLDIVETFFHEDGTLKPPATEKQLQDAFAWACEFGRTAVVDFLLRHVPVDLRVRPDGQNGLHWAAYGGHPDTVRLLLDRGAAVNARDPTHHSTPLEWALYQWGNSTDSAAPGAYYDVVAMLIRAGAVQDPAWADDDPERNRAMKKVASDPRMQAALA